MSTLAVPQSTSFIAPEIQLIIDNADLEKKVLVMGGENVHGQKHIVELIRSLNGRERWIVHEFSERPSLSLLKPDVGLVLTHTKSPGTSVQAFRKETRSLVIQTPLRPLTSNEIKAILQGISDRRIAAALIRQAVTASTRIVSAAVSSNGNGNGLGHLNGRHHESDQQPASTVLESSREATPAPSAEDEDPLRLIETFQKQADKVGLAILHVREECDQLRARNAELEAKLADADQFLCIAQEGMRESEAARKDLEKERNELRNRLSVIESAFKGASSLK